MKGTPEIKLLQLQTTINVHQKRASKDITSPLSINSKTQSSKIILTKNDFNKENITIDLKEGLYGGNKLDDSHFRAILRDSNCCSVKSTKSNSKQIQKCFGHFDKGTYTLVTRFTKKENYTPQKDLVPFSSISAGKKLEHDHIQKLKENRNKRFIPYLSPNRVIVTCPGELEVRRHSMVPCYPFCSLVQNEVKRRLDSLDRNYSLQTEPAPVTQINKFTFLGALTTYADSYNEEGGQTSRFPDNDDANCINEYELNSVVAQEDSKIEVKQSREKKLFSRIIHRRKSSKSHKN